MKYSIIIITHNRIDLLKNCLKSIDQAKHNYSYEVIVVLNGQDDISNDYLSTCTNINTFKKISKTSPAEARNQVIQIAKGEYLCFLDDDVILPQSYFQSASKNLIQEPLVFGGPDQTYPNSTIMEKAIGLTLTSPLATGNTRYRHWSNHSNIIEHPDESNFILCNLWIKRKYLIDRNLSFDGDFFRNEENVLLSQIKDENMIYDSDLFVFHKRKGNIIHLFSAVSRSGYFRIKSFYKYPEQFSIKYLLPLIALIMFISTLIVDQKISLFLIYAYLTLLGIFSIRKNDILYFPLIFITHVIIHFSYTCGLIFGIPVGLLKKLTRQFTY